MALLTPGPCEPWLTPADIDACCGPDDPPVGLLDDCAQAASELLWALSGRQFGGVCQTTVRPCAQQKRGGRWLAPDGWDPTWGWAVDGGWCDHPHSSCGGPGPSQIGLGVYPIVDVVEVVVDGATLDDSLYRLDDQRWLVRLEDPDGTRPGWPASQDLTLPASAEGTWEVTFTWGVRPPAAGVLAARALACELAKGCTGGDCALDPRVTALARQGVTLQMTDLTGLLDDGRTGLLAVDAFLAAFNPKRIAQPAAVLSPDVGPHVRRAGQPGGS